MKILNFLVTVSILFTIFGCKNEASKEGKSDPVAEPYKLQQTLYHGGDIITMAGEEPSYVEAVVQREGQIIFTGTKADALVQFEGKAELVDLQGKTMLPGFIDGHAHFGAFSAQAIGAQILPPPDAGANNIAALIDILKDWNTPENRALTGWIFGAGFDDSVLEEKRFPTKHDLDKVTTEFPIMIIHISGHFAAVNSKGLEQLNITAETKNPEGGLIRRENGNEPNGVLEELAAIPYFARALTPKTLEAAELFFESGQNMALSYGYTTAQEGRAMLESHALLSGKAKEDKLKLDVVSYVDYMFVDSLMATKWNSKEYTKGYRIGGMKLTLDGSPQGRTAWRTQPYLLLPDGAEEGYLGYPAIPNDSDVEAIYKKSFENDWQILTHANGDAAMDQMIRTMSKVSKDYDKKDRRNVLIHGQYVREDQLDAFKDLDVIASLFPLHTFYWGDWHKQIIGEELGNKISPTRSALNKGLRLTIHTDAPVALPNLMRMVGISVERKSRSGQVIGAGEKLTAYEALKGITEWSAYQHFEEDHKGTLEEGKLADLVILDKNPLKVEEEDIKDIVVLETIKAGRTVYSVDD
ncbi:amidohydrolase [Lutimonas saemankumensis]|uniref:amidohydrolase n=1 Tax=Lutimonas saemankumensis TaxID=483016 RepID=UPI001CD559D2|nr:amidohydrolase [Lutimonas saemankumensis]MCA0933077.1 amidohydrolase [Lutimonas saemankumensis]